MSNIAEEANMFTGIIEEVGKVVHVEKVGGAVRLTIDSPRCAKELKTNDSISVNGVCQTVIRRTDVSFTVEAVEETLRKTTLGELTTSSPVNLELAMRLDDRIGGHLVQGHVDGVGTIKEVKLLESSWLITIEIPAEFSRYIIPVGSIAVDGISLTVASLRGNEIVISIIPHTLDHTTVRTLKAGSKVNLEFDLVGKYIERLMKHGQEGPGTSVITAEKLGEWGYGAP